MGSQHAEYYLKGYRWSAPAALHRGLCGAVLMTQSRTTIAFIACLFLVGTSRGDLTAITRTEDISPPTVGANDDSLIHSVVVRSLADFDWFAIQSLPPLTLGDDSAHEPAARHVLADRQGSLHLCFYALLGLGLFKSVPCARRLPIGAIPAWYHEGGPSEIGHLLALSSDGLCTVSVCFTQPEVGVEDLRPLYRLGVVTPLWRESQFVSTVLVPRGPPFRSLEAV